MKKLLQKLSLTGLAVLACLISCAITTPSITYAAVTPTPVAAANTCPSGLNAQQQIECGACIANGGTYAAVGGCTGGQNTDNIGTFISNILNTAFFAVGIISVGFIIYAGIKYSTSAGDSNKITSAKNTLTYAIIGLIVAILAFAIVTFITSNLNRNTTTTQASTQIQG